MMINAAFVNSKYSEINVNQIEINTLDSQEYEVEDIWDFDKNNLSEEEVIEYITVHFNVTPDPSVIEITFISNKGNKSSILYKGNYVIR